MLSIENKTMFTLGCLMLLVFFSLLIYTMTNVEYVEKPCVDGAGDKNLEGVMCEKTEYTGNHFVAGIIILITFWGVVPLSYSLRLD